MGKGGFYMLAVLFGGVLLLLAGAGLSQGGADLVVSLVSR